MTTTNELAVPLTAAIYYARKGWAVLPLHEPVKTADGYGCSCGNADCSSAGKHPCVEGGVKSATTDEATIQYWWTEFPSRNIGVATGAESELLVIDIDPRHDGDSTLQQLIADLGVLPDTLTAYTGGGGRHLFFKHPGKATRNSMGKLGPGIDIKADGGYVVAEPSVHASGNPYVFDDPEAPLANLPPAWLARLEAGGSLLGTTKLVSGDDEETIPEGKRNPRLTSYAGSLRAMGLDESAIVDDLLQINSSRCVPPLPETEIQGIARSICRYPAGDVGKKPLRSRADLLVEIATTKAELFHTPGGHDSDGYASIRENGTRQTWPVNSKAFRRWLAQQFYLGHDNPPLRSDFLPPTQSPELRAG